jgi:hypothetical protein
MIIHVSGNIQIRSTFTCPICGNLAFIDKNPGEEAKMEKSCSHMVIAGDGGATKVYVTPEEKD